MSRRSATSVAFAATMTAAAVVSLAPPALATGLSDYDDSLGAEPEQLITLGGYLRLRGAMLHNLDLDRGPTPSGQLLYPVPLGDPTGQTLTTADMRLRTDVTAYWPSGGAAVKVRIDALDNVALGSAAEGIPSASTTQSPGVVVVKRAYGEVLTPFGLLAIGRMGNSWGLGMLANGGDCIRCDSGDAADRVAFITPLVDHLWAAAYDLTSTGPTAPHQTETHVISVVPTAFVHTLTFAVMHHRDQQSLERRRRAGRYSFDYGAYVSHRWQNNDVPATYLPTAQPTPVTSETVMARGYQATAVDAWLRLYGSAARIELEAAFLNASVEQASLIPGVLLQEPVTSNQFGLAIESEFGDKDGPIVGGLNGGFASGDPAPGFGAFPQVGAAAARAGDLDGAQAIPPFDNQVNNFRFHPDYRIDRILFREIVGAVTDAVYIRPHVRWRMFDNAQGRLDAALYGVASFAVEPSSTPGGERGLGVEIDPSITYTSRVGFVAALEQATLIPLAGLNNRDLGLDAKVAQLWRLRLNWMF